LNDEVVIRCHQVLDLIESTYIFTEVGQGILKKEDLSLSLKGLKIVCVGMELFLQYLGFLEVHPKFCVFPEIGFNKHDELVRFDSHKELVCCLLQLFHLNE
jgi:hypothetical protein